jgi:patatin-like phospholipase/acyl hydrolase
VKEATAMAEYRILSLDGGGIRGIITAIILRNLSATAGLAGWLDKVDLIAGTSTGGLLALGLAYGLGPDHIRELYETKGNEIFDDSWIDDLVDIYNWVGADYHNKNLRRELKSVFKDTTLGQLKRQVLITAFDLDNEAPDPSERAWKPKLFHNFPGEDNDNDQLAYEVGLYTSAAPTYFPSVDGYIDGGVYANNPSMCALAQSQDPRIPHNPPISEIALLSLGTGTSLYYIVRKNLDWGYAQWAKPLITLMLDGIAGIADYQCKQILRERYHRLAPTFPPGVSIPMDGIERIPDMIKFAEGIDLADTVEWLKVHWL